MKSRFCATTLWASAIVDRGSVMAKESISAPQDNALVRALARWEWEGGGLELDGEKRAALVKEKERILQCLVSVVRVFGTGSGLN